VWNPLCQQKIGKLVAKQATVAGMEAEVTQYPWHATGKEFARSFLVVVVDKISLAKIFWNRRRARFQNARVVETCPCLIQQVRGLERWVLFLFEEDTL